MNNTTLRLSVFFPCCYTMIPRLGMAGWTRRGPLVSLSRVCPDGFFFLLVGVVGRSWWYGRLMGFRSLGGRVWGEGRWEWDGDTRFAGECVVHVAGRECTWKRGHLLRLRVGWGCLADLSSGEMRN